MTATSTAPEAEATQTGPSLLSVAGPTYFPIAFVARLPFAMMVVGVLTLVVAGRESLAFGGLSSAMVGLGAAAVGPLVGAAADRFGQRRAVLAAGIVNSLALLLMTWVVFSSLPGWAVLASAAFVGASAPQVGPMSRSRLVAMITTRLPVRRRAQTLLSTMAYESAADEVIFVFGPVIVGLLATTMNVAAPMVGAAVLTAIFVTAFALHPSGRAVPAAASGAVVQAPARELLRPAVIVVVVGVFGMGLFFGSTLTGLTAFMRDAGNAESAGLYYGVMGVGSAALALGSALLPQRFTLAARWVAFASVLVLGATVMALAPSLPWLVLGLAVAGIGVGPTLVTNFSLGADRSPVGRSATVMTIMGSAVILGQSTASAVNGLLAENVGTAAAQAAPVVAALVVLSAGVANATLARRR
ncbi:Major facilitator superfamily MFS_1 OS=Tsukamurella paurometabola (strain ATCC 8368 / DSM /CCUG 35730 / CIP 100753 / JCM 10117 / KCTC 9821 / NBRC 16120/ NCIMB 702349 / NCTC 13040) OX=521096 GN=Tpau_2992 PE=4 SV=1 [Tsukamurella paurometabola]|uniref:Major facilitator superfamily MFS_1 n=1 Tax=Tsukamurella paurometabola (strain ATCC 8368 / DSM 20162 / CCUG 35730 / CIP 100753 / JCM 10117 / KCTC 9821 / NBRC 16120 / NCIMB 702349 / NCTC 13040) TaxID=521096 RepID=D5UU85_TSUPD|nr:MFS transporter [Tsukamurella paurometabola]ADG79588.1 major facilitator superfamily MFS_1 [Tsukamurella paurometabola DSM 20162]SUP36348.1 Major Facilitator Superfamily [Tsukamurella paurometabola]